MRILTALFLLCYSCGIGDPLPPAGIDEELYPYYERFLVDLAVRQLPLKAHVRSIRWVDGFESDRVIGTCSIFQSWMGPRVYTFRTISIRRDVRPETLGRLMYHELGHCMLDLCHSSNPDDIMYHLVGPGLSREDLVSMLDLY